MNRAVEKQQRPDDVANVKNKNKNTHTAGVKMELVMQ